MPASVGARSRKHSCHRKLIAQAKIGPEKRHAVEPPGQDARLVVKGLHLAAHTHLLSPVDSRRKAPCVFWTALQVYFFHFGLAWVLYYKLPSKPGDDRISHCPQTKPGASMLAIVNRHSSAQEAGNTIVMVEIVVSDLTIFASHLQSCGGLPYNLCRWPDEVR